MAYSALRNTDLKLVTNRPDRIKLCFDILADEHPDIKINDVYGHIHETKIKCSRNMFFALKAGEKDTSNIDLISLICRICNVEVRFVTRGNYPPSTYGPIKKHVDHWEDLAELPDSMQSKVIRVAVSAKDLLFK